MSNSFSLIGLTGPAGSGKDTVAALLRTHCAYTPLAFADPLRGEVAAAFGVSPALLIERETKEHPMTALALQRCMDPAFEAFVIAAHQHAGLGMVDTTAPRSPRQVMQWWGTEYRRADNPAYWTRATAKRICDMHLLRTSSRFVITDVRFDNEAALVREFGGQIWQIVRPDLAPITSSHSSEVTGAEFAPDVVITNRHDMRHLQQLVLGAHAARAWGLPGVRVEVPA